MIPDPNRSVDPYRSQVGVPVLEPPRFVKVEKRFIIAGKEFTVAEAAQLHRELGAALSA